MKFKQYLIENKDGYYIVNDGYDDYTVCYLIERLKINYNDSSIKRLSDHHYLFMVNDEIYDFHCEPYDIGNKILYNVYFISRTSFIQKMNKFSITDTYNIFNKVITCMIYFINDHNPYEFTFSAGNKKLSKIYKTIIIKIRKKKPFNKYIIKSFPDDSFNFRKMNKDQHYEI